jgi:hypothetical protein
MFKMLDIGFIFFTYTLYNNKYDTTALHINHDI